MIDAKREIVLIVDDMQNSIDILSNVLCNEYEVKVANNGRTAISIASKIIPDIILLDIVMPGMSGYEVCAQLKSNPLLKDIPVIFITAKNQVVDEARGFQLGAVDYIRKPIYPLIVKARVDAQLTIYNHEKELQKKVRDVTQELRETRLEIINKLGIIVEYKDRGTGNHVNHMGAYCNNIAKAYGFNEENSELISHASPMHDIGKIGIPDKIILKPGKLDADEWEIMKSHSQIGADIIGQHENQLLQTAYIIALQHHEKWDGTGYPKGLKGEDISIYARIVTVADVFDALISDRPYKKAWDVDRAVNQIFTEEGKTFDPQVVVAFRKALPDIRKII